MTKMIKLSLAAAVAVSALSTTASAGSLEDAIKDTTISGKATIGYNNVTTQTTATNKTTNNETEYDLDITMTTKVNDIISFTTGLQADHEVTIDGTDSTDAQTTKANGSKITLTKAYFTAKTDVATVMIGKQKQPTPFLDDERGDGIVALIPAGPVTIAAGHFTGMNGGGGLFQANDISAAAVIGTFGPVNASLWYAKEASTIDGYSANVNGVFGPVKVDLTHSSAELIDSAASENETLTKLIVSGKVDVVNLVAAYATTNKTTAARGYGVDWEGTDSKTNFALDILDLDSLNDSDAILVGASTTFGKTTIGANYLMVDVNTAADATELDISVSYAMSKNFSITGLYADANIDYKAAGAVDNDDTRMELSLNYKF